MFKTPACRSLPTSFDFAKLVICGDGSEPIERMHIKGVQGSDSLQVASRSSIRASPYSGPKESKKSFSFIFF